MSMSGVPSPPPNNNRNYSYLFGSGSANYVYGSQGAGQNHMSGVQCGTGEFKPIACTDCGRDNLGTLKLSPDNNPRCTRCHDKFMMVHDIPKCGGCNEPTPFGHKVDNIIHCDICYHHLLANKLINQVDSLNAEDRKPALRPRPEVGCDQVGNKVERPEMDQGTTRGGLFDRKFKSSFRKESKKVGPTNMTPDRLKVLQELQHGLRLKYVNESELNKRCDEILNYDFTDDSPKKASKSRKPMKETKVGGWFSKLATNVKEGWAEVMEEKEEVDEKIEATSEEKNVESSSEVKLEIPSEEPKET